MSTYLVVLDSALPARNLRFGLLNLVSQHKVDNLVLLQSPQMLPDAPVDVSLRAAWQHATLTQSLLVSMGLPVIDSVIGHVEPLRAVVEEMSSGRHAYDGIVLTSRPSPILRLLRLDLGSRLESRFTVPVAYVDRDIAAQAEADGRRVAAGGLS